ncbi:polysaccharide deacetylase family protein [Candidatus Saccharibacteria bacterium]|nr:polysaccharide deacetylase family protein [Candidatus Saccharibacteria bacterium]
MARHVRITERDIRGKKLIALTFDDGPSPSTTPALLNILKMRDVPATFFVLGNMARNYPDIIKHASEEGHEIANHTMYHQNLIRISANSVQADINESRSVLEGILGQSPSLTRPPYGNINDNVRRSVGTPMILWSVDTLDWKTRDPDSILSVAMDEVHDGAIILMHDIYDTTVSAVPKLIDTMRQNGYEFVTISELVKERGITLEDGAVYYNFRP